MIARPVKVYVDLLNKRLARTIRYIQENWLFPDKAEEGVVRPI